MSLVSNYGWLVAIALQLVIVWGVWSARRAFASKEEVQALTGRLTVIETRYEAMPSRGDLRRLHERIDEAVESLAVLRGTTAATEATVTAMKTTVELLHQHHMGGGK